MSGAPVRLSRMSPAASPVDPIFAPIYEAFAGQPGVTYGKLMRSYGLRIHGKIFSMLVDDRVVYKLPKARVDELIAGGKGEHFDTGNGRVMREWIAIHRQSRINRVKLAEEAKTFVSSLIKK